MSQMMQPVVDPDEDETADDTDSESAEDMAFPMGCMESDQTSAI